MKLSALAIFDNAPLFPGDTLNNRVMLHGQKKSDIAKFQF